MKKIFLGLSIVLAIAWMISFFVLHAGTPIHTLLVLSVFFWLHSIIALEKRKFPEAIKPTEVN